MSALYSCLKGKNDTIMAAKSAEGTQTIENEETPGDCSGKKKSKFQAFKKLFVKKRRKESPAPSRDGNLKPSQSSSDVSVSGVNESALQPAHESMAKSGMGSKAVSHDSVFISEMESSAKDTSHENIPGKVKALQLQLQQNIRIGSPPQGIIHKKLEDSGTLSDDDGLPRSPPEITSLHEILALSSGKASGNAQRRNSLSLGGTDSEDEPESREISSCPISPLNSGIPLCSNSPGSRNLVDFSAPLSSVVCLDNTAAKHKIAVKPKKRRGPAMNLNRIKDGTAITKNSHTQEKVKPENMVVCDHEVGIPHSGKSSAEQEGSNEQAKIMEDTVQETEIDRAVSLIAQDDSSVENTQTCETSSIGKQILAPLTDINDSDVDFHTSLNVEDQVNQNEKDSKTERESKEISCSGQPVPMHEPNEVTADMEPSECEDTAIETVHLEVSEDVECDIFEDDLKNQGNTSVFERVDPIFKNKDQDQEHEEYAKVLPNLSGLQNVLPEVTVSTDTNVLSTAQKQILETDSKTSLIVVDEPVCNIASECAVMCQSTDNKNDKSLFTEEKLQEPSANTTTNQPRVTDTPSTDKKLETLGLKIIESPMDLSIDDGSITCVTGSINLVSGANSKDIQCTKESSTEISKTIKPTEVYVDGKLRTSNKPVRFTVAPAWQRSLSVGSGVKETTCKNKVSSAVKSESFDESDHPVIDLNQEDYRKSEKNNEMVKTNKDDMCGAFGVRLRRTSSSRKYNEEYPEEQFKLHLSPVETVSITPTRNVQMPTKTPQPPSDFVKFSKPSHTSEDKSQKQKAEDLSSQENSEPAWITVAKLKQKGFQVHPLAREHSASKESDKSEGRDESSQKKSAAASPQELEVKRIDPVSTECPVVEESLPESEKSTPSTTPQNPDEPPWFSLAKKKAKAWSKMP